MVNKYHNSKIYKITSPQSDKIYIGSTTTKLSYRLIVHKHHYTYYQNNKHNYMSSYEIIKFDDAKIELIKNVKCENRNELNIIEGDVAKEYKSILVNHNIAGQTLEQYRKAKYKCMCGSHISLSYKRLHFQTQKHQQRILNII